MTLVTPTGAFGEATLTPSLRCHRCQQHTADSVPARYYVEDGGRVCSQTVQVCPDCDGVIRAGKAEDDYAPLDECVACLELREDCQDEQGDRGEPIKVCYPCFEKAEIDARYEARESECRGEC